ncbi:MAG: release factor glutamine methyltransferase [Oleiphilaceae bacterium]|jgi:release factor glutamine methyltransferase
MCTIEEALKLNALSVNVDEPYCISGHSGVDSNSGDGSDTSTSIEDALLDAELLLGHVLGCDRTYLKTWPEKSLSDEQFQAYTQLIKRRYEGQPVAHLLGYRDFWTLELFVSPSTLIPRPDTEILIEYALEQALPDDAKVLDLGTGTGAIALSLASERPNWSVTASDVFPSVVELAKKNALHNKLERVSVICSAWFDAFEGNKFNLIVSNPPYIDSLDPHLSKGDLRFEPTSALVAGDHGMADIRYIVQASLGYLLSGGWLMVEHGYQQGVGVRESFRENGFECVKTVLDYGSNERVTMGQKR